jgi:hypothetical protein
MEMETICTAHFNFQIITRRISHKSLITGFIYFHDEIKNFPKYEIINLYLPSDASSMWMKSRRKVPAQPAESEVTLVSRNWGSCVDKREWQRVHVKL